MRSQDGRRDDGSEVAELIGFLCVMIVMGIIICVFFASRWCLATIHEQVVSRFLS